MEISDITPGTPLHADLLQLGGPDGCANVQLELRFQPDMHPFYPVQISLLKPRLLGVTGDALMSHPMLSLEGWDPMKSIKARPPFAAQDTSRTRPGPSGTRVRRVAV